MRRDGAVVNKTDSTQFNSFDSLLLDTRLNPYNPLYIAIYLVEK